MLWGKKSTDKGLIGKQYLEKNETKYFGFKFLLKAFTRCT